MATSDPRLAPADAKLQLGRQLLAQGQLQSALETFVSLAHEFPEADAAIAEAQGQVAGVVMAQGDLAYALTLNESIVSRFRASAVPRIMACVAAALSNAGVILMRERRPAEAVQLFQDLCDTFGSSSEPALLDHVSCALYNKGIALRDAGRRAEAIGVFSEAVERFGDSSAAGSRRFAAMALYSRAITQAALRDPKGSVASSDEMWKRFGDSTDPAIVERVAKVMYHRAILFGVHGMLREAIQGFEWVIGHFPGDQPPILPAITAGARRRATLYAAIESAQHALHNLVAQTDLEEWDRDVSNAPPDQREALARRRDEYREMIQEQSNKATALHQQAASTLINYVAVGAPFGLFLWNFDAANAVRSGTLGTMPIRISMPELHSAASAVERQIVQAYGDKIPFVGLAHNTPSPLSFYEHHIPKLEVANERWQSVVEELVKAAEIIFVHVGSITPGVLEELAVIQSCDKATSTMVLISADDEQANMTDVVAGAYQAPPPGPRASADDERLKPFPFVRNLAAFETDPLKEFWSGLMDMTLSIDPNERAHWDGVVF